MKKFTFLKNAMHGLAIKSMLLVVFLLSLGTSDALAEKKPYAVFYDATKTLTFKYGEKETLGTNEYWLENAQWTSLNITKAVFDASFADARPTTCKMWFNFCTQLASIEGIENLNTEKVTDMSYMFYDCQNLQNLNLSKLNTKSVTNMSFMFYECKNLKNLNLSYFNTKSVTNMSNMFNKCEALNSLDLSNFETENVTNMEYMFSECTQLKTLTLSDKFNTQKVTSMRAMFYNCANIISLNLSGFDTKEVTDMRQMFKNCQSLTSLDLSKFNTQKVEDMIGVFENCQKLTSLNLLKFDTQSVTNMGSMFSNCQELSSLDLSNFDTQNVTNMGSMFQNCFKLTSLNLSNFDTQKVTNMSEMFDNCWILKSLQLTNKFNTGKVENMYAMFRSCDKLKHIDLSNFDTKNVKNMREMFRECKWLNSLDLTNLDTKKVTDMSYMFYGNYSIETLDLSNFDTHNVTTMLCMFNNCSLLKNIYVGKDFVVNESTIGDYMFENCSKLNGFASNKTGKEYANYHDGYFKKYIGTLGTEKLGATGTEPNLEVKNLNFTDYKNLELNVGESFIATSSNYIRKDIKNQWGTLYLPFETNLKDKNIRAFELLNVNDDAIELKEIEGNVNAWTPVFIKMNEGTTELNLASIDNSTTSVEAESATANSQYQLKGTTEKKAFTTTDTNCFILKGNKLMNPAKILEKTTATAVSILPYHVYMEANSSETNPARVFSIRVGGDATAIEELNEAMNDGKAEYYNLQGHRLNNLQKGVNIIKRGNKTIKVIIK